MAKLTWKAKNGWVHPATSWDRRLAAAKGLKRYLGGPCKKCGGSERFTSNRGCVVCSSNNHSKWRMDNHEAAKKQWIAAKKRLPRYRRYKLAKDYLKARDIRTPKWANMFIIEEAYALADLRTEVMGGIWSVDHIIPLRGKNVSGLHVHNNLRVIPRSVNLRKTYKWPANTHWLGLEE